jgi:hypothetical protein
MIGRCTKEEAGSRRGLRHAVLFPWMDFLPASWVVLASSLIPTSAHPEPFLPVPFHLVDVQDNVQMYRFII